MTPCIACNCCTMHQKLRLKSALCYHFHSETPVPIRNYTSSSMYKRSKIYMYPLQRTINLCHTICGNVVPSRTISVHFSRYLIYHEKLWINIRFFFKNFKKVREYCLIYRFHFNKIVQIFKMFQNINKSQ